MYKVKRLLIHWLILTTTFHLMTAVSGEEMVFGQNWPQWRGPHASGAWPDGNPPIEWNENKNIIWKTEIPGKGYSTPIIWEHQIFLTTTVETDRKKNIGSWFRNLKFWESDEENVFVIAGDFDLSGDGKIDRNSINRLKALVEKWGGKVDDNISVDTDFLILGSIPHVRRKPTFEEMEIDPMAMDKYNECLEKLNNYKKVRNQARDLSIPVFNAERFLYFIGYKTQSSRPGAF